MTERRRFLRFETALNALCEIVSEKWSSASKVKNISKEGALLAVPKQFKEGDELKLSMDVPGDNIPIFASCQVAWQKGREMAREGDYFETGVKFTKMDPPDKGRLLEYIYSQWLKLLDKSR